MEVWLFPCSRLYSVFPFSNVCSYFLAPDSLEFLLALMFALVFLWRAERPSRPTRWCNASTLCQTTHQPFSRERVPQILRDSPMCQRCSSRTRGRCRPSRFSDPSLNLQTANCGQPRRIRKGSIQVIEDSGDTWRDDARPREVSLGRLRGACFGCATVQRKQFTLRWLCRLVEILESEYSFTLSETRCRCQYLP